MSELKLDSNCLIMFLDETGHEEFADQQFPVFGLGGCATSGSSYDEIIRQPWIQMKNKFFNGANVPLHASDLRNPNQNQINALARFFRENLFSRFCAVSRRTTLIEGSLNPYQATALGLLGCIRRIASQYPSNSMVMIFEASDRGDMQAARFFPNFTFSVDGEDMPVEYGRMSKSLCEPGLEVADFIVHTAGSQVRDQLNGKFDGKTKFRKDFECIFHSVDKRLADYLSIDSVGPEKREP